MILQWPGFVKFNWDGIAPHLRPPRAVAPQRQRGRRRACAAGVIDIIRQIDTWYAGRYSKLVHLINSIDEGDRTMLDNSAVMWLPELADGNAHNNNNLPIVIAGSAGGYLKQGVSVVVDPKVTTKALGTGNSEASCTNGTVLGFNTGTSAATSRSTSSTSR